MKKLLAFLFLLLGLTLHAQVKVETTVQNLDTVAVMPPDTLILESVPKASFGEKLGKFLGIDNKEEEIKSLKETVSYQQELLDSLTMNIIEPRTIIKTIPNLDAAATASLKKDEAFLESLPNSYGNLPKESLEKITKEIDTKISELIRQRDSILAADGNKELLSAKNNVIQSLQREKNVIHLSAETSNLKDENGSLITENDDLKIQENKLKKYLYISFAILFALILIIAVIIQRKRIGVQDVEINRQLADINKKNTYLEYAARIIRHDMHSGINTYIPRGITSLEKKVSDDQLKELKIEGSLKMIKDGLAHTQKVYKNVYEFTNLVKVKTDFKKESINLKLSLEKYLSGTSYVKQVEVSELGEIEANEQLICSAIDNLIRNGLRYNNNTDKSVKIYKIENTIIIEDNGIGLSNDKFKELVRKGVDAESETGLGLNITKAIVEEHGFSISCEDTTGGTKMKINL